MRWQNWKTGKDKAEDLIINGQCNCKVRVNNYKDKYIVIKKMREY